MEKKCSVYKIGLDTPQGKILDDSIKSAISILVEINENKGVDLRILFDHDKALRNFGQFLKESIMTDSGLLNDRQVNSINVCTPEFLNEPSTNNNRFTSKENEIMALISRGESNKDIARLIQMNIETLRSHIKKAFIRMDVRGRIRAIRKYLRIKGEIFLTDSDVNMLLDKMGF